MKVILADDFTGASDTALKFVNNGFASKVIWHENIEGNLSDDLILAIDLDSRSLSSAEAYNRVKNSTIQFNHIDCNNIFKKIDSTLRGNIGAELDALIDYSEADFILVVPSYPDNERYVSDGLLYVGDKLLEDTYFKNDILTPVQGSSVKEVLSKSSNSKMLEINNQMLNSDNFNSTIEEALADNVKILICDAISNSDLSLIYDRFSTIKSEFIWCGSAGIAAYISDAKKNFHTKIIDNNRMNENILLCIGSVNEKTRDQLNILAKDKSVKSVKVKLSTIIDNKTEFSKIVSKITNILKEDNNVAMYTDISIEEKENLNILLENNREGVGIEISNILGEIVKEIHRKSSINGLILSGGDIAKSISKNLDLNEFYVVGKVEEGVPIGYLRNSSEEMLTITKAGGFGTKNSLVKSYNILRGGFINASARNYTSDGDTYKRYSRN